jgi:CRP/FNR family cyclic AMP-dependent transcriptional regulator
VSESPLETFASIRSSRHAFDVEEFLDSAGVTKRTADFQKNEVIFSQGGPAKDILYIKNGCVRLSVVSYTGKEAVVGVFGPGDFFGEWCLADQPRRMATATAMEPTSIRIIGKNEMLRLLHTKRILSDRFIAYLVSKNVRINEDLVNLLFNPTEKRLARALLLLAHYGKQGTSETTLPQVSQQLLAEMVGTTRTRVNLLMNKFRRLGLIRYDGRVKIHRSLSSVVLRG